MTLADTVLLQNGTGAVCPYLSAQVVQVYEGTSYILVAWEAGEDHLVEVCMPLGDHESLRLKPEALHAQMDRQPL